jgi:hypothetical protein
MAETAKKKNPKLWERAKSEAKAKMGGKHSARAMQLATKIYKDKGGEYVGAKSSENKLSSWTKQDWDYSGKEGQSRYLPKEARESLTAGQKAAGSRAKNKATKSGKQTAKYTPAEKKAVRKATRG